MVVIVVVGFFLDGERDGESFVVVVIRGRIQQQLYIHANPKANLFLSHLEFRLRDLPFHIHPSPRPPSPRPRAAVHVNQVANKRSCRRRIDSVGNLGPTSRLGLRLYIGINSIFKL